jgi:hypothetical protein
LVGGVDRPAITVALGLSMHEHVAFTQPVGWPADCRLAGGLRVSHV